VTKYKFQFKYHFMKKNTVQAQVLDNNSNTVCFAFQSTVVFAVKDEQV
jgi:hypothetical protein